MFQLVYTNRFKKDVKLLQRRGFNLELLKQSVLVLEESGELPAENSTYESFHH